MIKAIIFDMDGVLLDSEKVKAAAWKEILGKYGIEDGDSWYKERIGKTRLDLCREAVSSFSLPTSPEELAELKKTTYQKLSKEHTEPIGSSIKFLKSIPKDKFKVGLAAATNKAIIDQQLGMLDILYYFDAIVSGEDEVENNKPAPDIYLLAAKKLDLPPAQCAAIEDSAPGVESAKAAGMKCIAAPNDYTKGQDFSKADLVVDGLSGLDIQKILSLNPE